MTRLMTISSAPGSPSAFDNGSTPRFVQDFSNMTRVSAPRSATRPQLASVTSTWSSLNKRMVEMGRVEIRPYCGARGADRSPPCRAEETAGFGRRIAWLTRGRFRAPKT